MKKLIILAAICAVIAFAFTSQAQTRSVAFENTQFGKWVVTPSSTLKPQAGNHYAPKNAVDGSDKTAWAEAAKGDGIGEWIKITFDSPQKIGTIYVKNGYGVTSKRWHQNNRIKEATIQVAGGTFPAYLKDIRGEQVVKIPPSMRNTKTKFVKLTIKKVYRGKKWRDTLLNEFRPDLEEYNYE